MNYGKSYKSTKTTYIMSTLKGRNLISITDFSKEEYIEVLDIAEGFEKNP